MGRKPRFTVNQKHEDVEDVLIRHQGKRFVTRRFGIGQNHYRLNYWIAQYRAYGIEGLKPGDKNRKQPDRDKMETLDLVKKGVPVKSASVRLLIPGDVISRWLKCCTDPIKGESLMKNRGGKGVKKQHFGINVMEKTVKECIDSGHDCQQHRYKITPPYLYMFIALTGSTDSPIRCPESASASTTKPSSRNATTGRR